MSALGQALEASQGKAVAALGKAYIRREETPDDDLFRGLLVKIGLDDDTAITFLLAAWSVLREEKAQPPGEQQPAAKSSEPATDAQWKYIRKLADEKGTTAPGGPLTKEKASTVIEQLQAGTYKADDYEVPF